jgi:hypothetical protein
VSQPAGNGPNATDTTVTVFPDSVVVGQQFRVTATVTPKFGMPAGWVDFDLDGRTLPECHHVTIAGPVAQCLTSLPGTGEHTVNARFNAENTAALAGSVGAVKVTATRARTQLVVLPATSPLPGRPFTPTVLVLPVAPGYGHPSGTVTLTDDVAGDACTITLPSTSCELPGLPAGRHGLRAEYHGDANFEAAQSPPVAQWVLDWGTGAPAATPAGARPPAAGAPPASKPAQAKPVETKPVDSAPSTGKAAPGTIAAPPTESTPDRMAPRPPDAREPCGALTSRPYCERGEPYPNRP